MKEFAESASGNGGYNRKLFAEDAAQGFAFIDVCRKRYDVVLMNPPFGEFPPKLDESARKNYQAKNTEILAAFIERGIELKKKEGQIGAITSRTAFFAPTTAKWRQNIILPSGIRFWVELGSGILDEAMVETCMFAIGNGTSKDSLFIRPRHKELNGKLFSLVEPLGNDIAFYSINPFKFMSLKGSPFAYWIDRKFFWCFENMKSMEDENIKVRVGLQTGDDFRFIRLRTEAVIDLFNNEWITHAKGGDNSPFYTDIHLLVRWKNHGKEIKSYPSARLNMYSEKQQEFYLEFGMTFSYRTHRFSPAALPKNCITGVAGMGVFSFHCDLYALLSLLNSSIVNELISIRLGQLESQSLYQAGTVSPTPIPLISEEMIKNLSQLGKEICMIVRRCHIGSEISAFFIPEFIYMPNHGSDIVDYYNKILSDRFNKASRLFRTADKLVLRAYGFDELAMCNVLRKWTSTIDSSFRYLLSQHIMTHKDILSYIFGCGIGRWDIRIAKEPSLATEPPGPFEPLPVCSPGMLVGPNGLPATSGRIGSEEWMRARPNAITLPPEGSVKNPTMPDSEYPIELAWNGILVDDPAHKEDIISRMRKAFQVIWKEKADSIEQEACEILGIKDLRDYLRRPSGFFADHLKRYSKSRRQAPIYWPLSTTSGSYTLWIYYPRLTDQTLYRCVNDYINPKLEDTARDIEFKQKETERNRAIKVRQEMEDLLNLQQELKEFKSEMLRIAELPYKPDLNDGVLITASPLHKLFRLPKWSKGLKKCWENLEKGDYDWAHLSYSIWPERVREKCRKDRSLAIAHDLEDICEVEPKAVEKKSKKTNKKDEEQLGLI